MIERDPSGETTGFVLSVSVRICAHPEVDNTPTTIATIKSFTSVCLDVILTPAFSMESIFNVKNTRLSALFSLLFAGYS
jgi:hypothetical protein